MGVNKQSGFTIVETMIFLGVSGLLLVSLLAGTGIAIQRQRYSDSVNTTQSFFQQQFSETLNVINSRSGSEICNDNNVVSDTAGNGEAPGTSDCLVLGRAVDVTVDGATIDAYTVVGRAPATDDPGLTEDELLAQHRPTLVKNVEPEEFSIPWGAKVSAMRRSGDESVNRLLILRSPRSGVIYTYAYNTASGTSDASVGARAVNRSKTVNVCLQSADIVSSTSVVSIAMSGGPEAVKTAFDITNSGEQC